MVQGTTDRLFDGVAPATITALRNGHRTRDFAPGEDLLACDEMPPRLYSILDGRARVWRPSRNGRALVLYFVGAGEVVGIVPLMRRRPIPVSITATTAVRTECWSTDLFLRLVSGDAELAANAVQLVADRFTLVVDRLGDIISGRVDQQLARALLRIAGEEGAWTDTARVTVPVTRQDLADMTGTTLHTASRTLSAWGEQGLVRSTRGQVTIVDPHRLAAVAELAD